MFRYPIAQVLPPAFQGARQVETVRLVQQAQALRVADAAHRVNASPLHQAAEVERPGLPAVRGRYSRSRSTRMPSPGRYGRRFGMHVDADDSAGRFPRLPRASQPLQAQVHELTLAARFHGAIDDALDVPALGARRQLVRHVLGRQRQPLPAEMQAGQRQPEKCQAATPLCGIAGPARHKSQSHHCQHANNPRDGKTDHGVNGAAAQQPRRQAQQRPLPQAGRMAFQTLQGVGQRSTAQHGGFMLTEVSGEGLS